MNGGLISYGVDILLSYVDPLKFWMDQLTGDSAQVSSMAMTWASIGDSLRSASSRLRVVQRHAEHEGQSHACRVRGRLLDQHLADASA